VLHKWFTSFHDTPQRVNRQIWFGAFCFVFMSEVDTRNRYASFEAIFVHQNWHNRCMNRLSRIRERKDLQI
ncbi:hypothetical protein QP318_26795, partial [Escherichia coli]|nr:hypothetical protein [Escherichia coli]